MARFKVDQSTIPPGNMMLIYVFYEFLLFLGDPILLGRFKLRCEFLGLSVVDAKYLGCRADGDFILDDAREC